MKYTFDKVMHWVVTALVVVAIYVLLRRLSGVLLPFLVAWLVAYLLNPVVAWLHVKMKLKSRALPVLIVLLVLAGVLTGLFFLVSPMISKEVVRGEQLFMQFWEMESTQSFVKSISDQAVEYFAKNDFKEMMNVETLEALAERLLPGVVGLVQGTVRLLVFLAAFAITLLYMVFIMLDYDKINEGFRNMVPERYRTLIYGLFDDLESGMNSYFRGQALVALIVGILFAIGFTIIGLPMGVTIGLFIGVLNLVPYLQTVGILPVALLALMKSAETGMPFWVVALECTAVFAVVQTTQDMFLVPKIMGKAMGLKPAIILLSLSVWGSLLGFVGMIIALPLTTLMISYYKRYILGGKEELKEEIEES